MVFRFRTGNSFSMPWILFFYVNGIFSFWCKSRIKQSNQSHCRWGHSRVCLQRPDVGKMWQFRNGLLWVGIGWNYSQAVWGTLLILQSKSQCLRNHTCMLAVWPAAHMCSSCVAGDILGLKPWVSRFERCHCEICFALFSLGYFISHWVERHCSCLSKTDEKTRKGKHESRINSTLRT